MTEKVSLLGAVTERSGALGRHGASSPICASKFFLHGGEKEKGVNSWL